MSPLNRDCTPPTNRSNKSFHLLWPHPRPCYFATTTTVIIFWISLWTGQREGHTKLLHLESGCPSYLLPDSDSYAICSPINYNQIALLFSEVFTFLLFFFLFHFISRFNSDCSVASINSCFAKHQKMHCIFLHRITVLKSVEKMSCKLKFFQIFFEVINK